MTMHTDKEYGFDTEEYSLGPEEYGIDTDIIWNKIAGNWKEFMGKIRTRWGKLTDDDLQQIQGRKDELIGKLQKHYGKTKEEAERNIDEFLRTASFTVRPQ